MVYLYGAGGHAKVVIDVLEALKIKIGAIVDDYQQLPEILGYPVYRNSFLETLDAGSEIIITIGFNETRKEIDNDAYPSPRRLYPQLCLAFLAGGTQKKVVRCFLFQQPEQLQLTRRRCQGKRERLSDQRKVAFVLRFTHNGGKQAKR